MNNRKPIIGVTVGTPIKPQRIIDQTNVNTHMKNVEIHITDTERQSWNKKLDASELPNAVNDALRQAKESGEFDGKDGVDGKDGYTPIKGIDYFDGLNGKDGIDGHDGYTPIKGVDYFDGDKGEQGVSVIKAEINNKGELIITLSDNTVFNLGVVVGGKGDKGDSGTNGQDGDDGVGILQVNIVNNELIITLTDATVINLGNIKGEKGDKGDTGENGKDAITEQTYNPKSQNAQSGLALAEALKPIEDNIGDIESALDKIIEIQNELIGGVGV